jgi:hypothetical protein
MPASNRRYTQWLLLCGGLMALLANFPLLGIANRAATFGGVPVLYLYLFILWLLFSAGLWLLERRCRKP